ncbi:TetR/AcrR family transcriptional regulator [Lacisediminihabitans changchengi]|uniref:TetR/AcrR family transcriptional regulator n=1 Tax=Lacisediminihabitans changchengi TaxID=2787634 RepID=A0A934SLR7_9MICO|nr:TetR/AcrR family transcriptional regulator [Lacisediminihabitans changchengi]MBK4347696.1 TetR/AcrR family transcriptional regulator [Lacisediminihabitans changchengi]
MTATEPRTRRRPALERVIHTSDRLFYERGIHATGVDQIVAEADVSKATLYAHFATKDDLIVHYLRGRSTRWREYLSTELDRRGGTPRQLIGIVFDVLGEWFIEDGFRGCPFINAEAECDQSLAVHDVTTDHRTWIHGLFAGLARAAGSGNPDSLAYQLTLLYDGAMTSSHSEPHIDWATEAKTAALMLTDNATRSVVVNRSGLSS